MMRLLIALCLLVSSVYAQAPGEVYLTPKIDLHLQPVAVAGLENRTLNVPPGFVVELFAEDIGKGRLMAWSPDSVLHVAVMGTRGNSEWRADPNRTGRVVALPDRDRDGRADEVRTVADDLLWPNSVAFYQGAMYVADTDHFEVREYFRSIAPFTRQDTLDVERMERPVATVAAHTAPMAIHFYTGDRFPSEVVWPHGQDICPDTLYLDSVKDTHVAQSNR